MQKGLLLVFITALSTLPCACQSGATAGQKSVITSHKEDGPMEESKGDLPALIVRRLTIVAGVAKAKWNKKSPIEDLVREHDVLSDVSKKAAQAGLPTDWVQHFFRLQIEAAKLVEYQLFSEWKKEGRTTFDDAPDLTTESRPQLDAVSTEMVDALRGNWKAISTGRYSRGCVPSVAKRYPKACAIAAMPLQDGSAETSLLIP